MLTSSFAKFVAVAAGVLYAVLGFGSIYFSRGALQLVFLVASAAVGGGGAVYLYFTLVKPFEAAKMQKSGSSSTTDSEGFPPGIHPVIEHKYPGLQLVTTRANRVQEGPYLTKLIEGAKTEIFAMGLTLRWLDDHWGGLQKQLHSWPYLEVHLLVPDPTNRRMMWAMADFIGPGPGENAKKKMLDLKNFFVQLEGMWNPGGRLMVRVINRLPTVAAIMCDKGPGYVELIMYKEDVALRPTLVFDDLGKAPGMVSMFARMWHDGTEPEDRSWFDKMAAAVDLAVASGGRPPLEVVEPVSPATSA